MNYLDRRSENLKITMTMSGATALAHLDDVKRVMPHVGEIAAEDTLKCDYKFVCDYYGEVIENLQAVRRLMQVSSEAQVECLSHAESLIVAVLDELRAIQTA